MKIRNSTDFPNHYLRRMISWICGELGCPVRKVKEGWFSRYNRSCRGTYFHGGRFLVMIGSANMFPTKGWNYRGAVTADLADRVEALVEVTAHELTHLDFYRNDKGTVRRHVEARTVIRSIAILSKFRENRAALESDWSELPARAAAYAKTSIVDKRAAKAEENLQRWQRKLKIAKTKIKKLKRQVAYYQRRKTNDQSGQPPGQA